MTRQHSQDDTTLVPKVSISLATPSSPPSVSSGKRHHRRGSSLSNANPALLATTFTPSPLSVLSPLDEEFDRMEATKKDKSNRPTAIYTNLFQRITSFGSSGSGKGADEEVVDHIGAEMKKDPIAPRSKPISTSWSLKRNTFGTTTGGGTNSSDLSDNQSSRFGLIGKRKKGSTKKPCKHEVAAVMSSLDPWDSCDDMLLQGTDDEDPYDNGANGSSLSVQFLKGGMGGRRRNSDDATTTAESEQGVIPRLGKGAMVGMEDWMMHPRTAAIRGTFYKLHRDTVPVPASAIASTTASDNRMNRHDKMRPVSSSAEYTTISLASPPVIIYSSQTLGSSQSAHESSGATSLSRAKSLDSSFYLKKGSGQEEQDQDEDARVRRMMNGDYGDDGQQDVVFDYRAENDDDEEDTDFSLS
ncbi:hypothetical protein BGW39_001471 [Mortierella sp. 14UC]|nr:hypothetical protein BGW39_001471 [Mortierella sp. 14UC]